MEIRLNFTCAQSAKSENELLQKFKNELDKQIASKTEGVNLPLSSDKSVSESVTNIKTILQQTSK